MKTLKTIFILVLLMLTSATTLAEENTTTGTLSDVIVYRGQALVTRTIDLGDQTDGFEIVVTDMPEHIIPDTLYTQTPTGITVSSVRYRKKTIKEDTREEVKKIKELIAQAEIGRHHAQKNMEMAHINWSSLDKLENYSVNAKSADLEKGLLQSGPVIEIVTYIETQRAKFRQASLEYEDKVRSLNKEIEKLNKKLDDLNKNRQTTIRQAVLFVNRTDPKADHIKLNYLVHNANWSPQYNLRALTDNKKCNIEYNATIHQSTGESWNNVSLSLSTAQPSMVASAPVLNPLQLTLQHLTYGKRNRRGEEVAKQIEQIPSAGVPVQSEGQQISYFYYEDMSEEFESSLRSRRQQAKLGREANYGLNALAITNQAYEIAVDKKGLAKMKQKIEKITRTEGIAVTYKLNGSITLPSRSEQQLVNIAAVTVEADFHYVATPLLTDYVYLQGKLANNTDTIFLPGSASMFRNGQFVGKSSMPLVTINETFDAGFGIDSQIKVVRELEDKTHESLWGNRIDINNYRIAIHNYKNTPIKLQVFDRLPYTEHEELFVYDFATNTDLSKDAEYVRTLHKKGILRWDLNLKPNTADKDANIIIYKYTIKYDNDFKINPVSANQ